MGELDPTTVVGSSGNEYENIEVPDPDKGGTTGSIEPNEGYVQGEQGE
mgnify:CR=1 FL=1